MARENTGYRDLAQRSMSKCFLQQRLRAVRHTEESHGQIVTAGEQVVTGLMVNSDTAAEVNTAVAVAADYMPAHRQDSSGS